MCTVTSRRVRCGCTVWLLTTLGECGLSLSLGLRPIKNHSINYKMRNNQCVCWVSLELGCRRPVVLSKRSCMGVRDPNGCERPVALSENVLHGCERPVVLSEKLCMGVRDPWHEPKSSVAQRKHTIMFIT